MLSDREIIFRLILSVVLSGLIGLEREAHGRAAGLRTHILVCIGSCLIMFTSMHLYEVYKGLAVVDPARIAAQVVSGIGFLGAGTILRFRASVRGLTTAASLWTVAGLGLAIGSGFYKAAYFTTLLALIALILLNKLERIWLRKDWYKFIEVETRDELQPLEEIRKILSFYDVEIRDFEIVRFEEDKVLLRMWLKLLTRQYDDEILSKIAKIQGVYKVKWE
ncbi:MAG: MgtC/SapB family protein [Candidatus Omnitrophica bacterium]|nr:MgtC/SapB family protein [Candidatus Omnitrophota bacterium]MCM8793691.1 MgtC/SapB family protein [Candidatus Omnitrophota bacterium]